LLLIVISKAIVKASLAGSLGAKEKVATTPLFNYRNHQIPQVRSTVLRLATKIFIFTAIVFSLLVPLTAQANPKIIYDGRNTKTTDYKVNAREEYTIVQLAYPGFSGRGEAECNAETDEEARKKGLISPSVNGKLAGSFTRPNAQQVAYIVYTSECTSRGNQGKNVLLIVEDGKLVQKVLVSAFILERKVDLENDGIDELFLGWSPGTHSGATDSYLTLASFRGSFHVIKDFNQTMSDRCGGTYMEGDKRAVSITTVITEISPENFALEYWKAPCSGGRYRYAGKNTRVF
jgi:hypothetical protein